MKKTICLMLCVACLTVCLVGCDDFVVRGLESYSGGHTMFATDSFLPNRERFWERYEYIEGDYYFSCETERWVFSNIKEVALLYLKFDDTIYEEVKSFVLENIVVEEERTYSYNGYCFCEDMSDYYEGSSYHFPSHFTFTGYHDEKRLSFFLEYITIRVLTPPSNRHKTILSTMATSNPSLKYISQCTIFRNEFVAQTDKVAIIYRHTVFSRPSGRLIFVCAAGTCKSGQAMVY